MADKSVLMSGPMVCASLEDRKTQTRRLLTIKGHKTFSEFGPSDTPSFDWTFRDARMLWHDYRHGGLLLLLPYQVGDRLWVKETWRPFAGHSNWDLRIRYAADGVERHFEDGDYDSHWNWPKAAARGNVSPRFMPKWASRLTLIVTDVRVQRLQDISDDDAIAEGILECEDDGWGICYSGTHWTYPVPVSEMCHYPREAFAYLWNGLNEKSGFGWITNPWIAAYTFTVHPQNINAMESTNG